MDVTKLLGLKVAGPKDRARISEVTTNFIAIDELAENWNGFSNTGTIRSEGTDFRVEPALKIATELFSLTLKMPRAYAEGDTVTVDGIAYNLYQGTDPALSDAWKAGEVVTVNFDKTSRRCWASAGGGAPRPLPAQVSNMQASTPEGETPSIVFSWTNPQDENFAGMVLIVKEGSAPNSVTDGTQAYKGNGTAFTYTEGVQWEHTYFARGFAYNSQGKYQLDATGAIAGATPSDVPDTVSELKLEGNKGSAVLSWVNPTQQSFQEVKVVQKIDSAPENPSDGTVLYTGKETTFTATNLQDSIHYYFAVFAFGKNGKYKSPAVKEYTPKIYPKYTFTGNHTLVKDENNHWRIKFLSSGVLEWLDEDMNLDVYLVGGGAGGEKGSNGSSSGWGTVGGDGGYSGYTKTVKKHSIHKNDRVQVEIGAGGRSNQGAGGTSKFASISVSGGTSSGGGSKGGRGGSWTTSNPVTEHAGEKGGSDGAGGQGTTTREFGDAGAPMHAGGGGGGGGGGMNERHSSTSAGSGGGGSPVVASRGSKGGNGSYGSGSNIGGTGGSGGGGYGGGGGGGGSGGADRSGTPGSGGSGGAGGQGIVIIRDAR